MTTQDEPRLQPDYAHNPDNTLAIVPNGDAPPLMRLEDAYAARIAELERERDELLWALRRETSEARYLGHSSEKDQLRDMQRSNSQRVKAILARYEAKETE